MSAHAPSWQARMSRFLAARSRRERWLLLAAALLLGMALLLRLGVWPAWRSLQSAPQEHARLEDQWQRMRALQAQSARLLIQPRRSFSDSELRSSLAPLGQAARLEVSGERAQLVLDQAPADAVATWLVQARARVGVRVREARLQRGLHEGQTVWSGTLLLDLPR